MTKPMLLPPDNSYPHREIIDAQTGVTIASTPAPAASLTAIVTEQRPAPTSFRLCGDDTQNVTPPTILARPLIL